MIIYGLYIGSLLGVPPKVPRYKDPRVKGPYQVLGFWHLYFRVLDSFQALNRASVTLQGTFIKCPIGHPGPVVSFSTFFSDAGGSQGNEPFPRKAKGAPGSLCIAEGPEKH